LTIPAGCTNLHVASPTNLPLRGARREAGQTGPLNPPRWPRRLRGGARALLETDDHFGIASILLLPLLFIEQVQNCISLTLIGHSVKQVSIMVDVLSPDEPLHVHMRSPRLPPSLGVRRVRMEPIGGELYLGELYLGEGGDVAIAPIVERIDAAYFSHMPSNNSAANISASNASEDTTAQVWSRANKTKLPPVRRSPRSDLNSGRC
jgi:hypothetical protein